MRSASLYIFMGGLRNSKSPMVMVPGFSVAMAGLASTILARSS